MPAVHYYLGRPARVWISAHSRRSSARQARNGSGGVHSRIPGQPATGFPPSVPAGEHKSPARARELAASLEGGDHLGALAAG